MQWGLLTAESEKLSGKRKNGLPFHTHLPGNLFRFEEMPRSFHWENPPAERKEIEEEDANSLGLQSLMIFLLSRMVLKESAKGFGVEMLISTLVSFFPLTLLVKGTPTGTLVSKNRDSFR